MNIINRIQKWMDTIAGQTFMQYAYSWGAAIVILGTLFKLTHIPGANLMLFIGMGTEVFVFIVAGFERVTEKDASFGTEGAVGQPRVEDVVQGGVQGVVQGVVQGDVLPAGCVAGQAVGVISSGALPQVGANQMDVVCATDASEIESSVKAYAERLNELTEVLGRVKVQADRMSTDSEEMENLNRTLTGIATVYELQLRNISKQVSTIEQIDEQTRRMAEQIQELNNVYGRMISALTVNMGNGK